MVGMLSSPVDLAMLLLLALLLFGAKRLPEIARSLGMGMREFKDSIDGITESEPSESTVVASTPLPPAPDPTQESSSVSTRDQGD
jgi:sec-independent protein translocase protein TatA